MKLCWLFVLFLCAKKGRLRLKAWRALRRACLVRAQLGQKGG